MYYCKHHKPAIISGVCLFDHCKNPERAYCDKCKTEHHQSHSDTVEINQFFKNNNDQNILKESYKQIQQEIIELNDAFEDIMKYKIDKILTTDQLEIQIRFQMSVKNFIKNGGLKELVDNFRQFSDFLKQKASVHSESIKIQSQNFRQSQEQQTNDEISESILSNASEQNNFENTVNNDSQMSIQQNSVIKTINDCSQILNITENNIIDNMHQEEKQFASTIIQNININQIQQYNFSLTHKSNKIILSDNNKIAQGNNFALCDQPLIPNFRNQFAFQILNCPTKEECIYLGVCDQNFVEQQHYESIERNLQYKHGAYLISQNGIIFTNFDQQFKEKNGKRQRKITFGEQDIVLVTVDTKKNYIKWELYNDTTNNANFRITIDSSQQLVPCVYLKYNAKISLWQTQQQ